MSGTLRHPAEKPGCMARVGSGPRLPNSPRGPESPPVPSDPTSSLSEPILFRAYGLDVYDTDPGTCGRCHGSGVIGHPEYRDRLVTCPRCDGTGLKGR